MNKNEIQSSLNTTARGYINYNREEKFLVYSSKLNFYLSENG
jgi:hypothetical protein